MQLGGIHIQYYFVCTRKLWLYAKNLGLEEGFEKIEDGRLLHDSVYKRSKTRELYTGEGFKIDILEGEYVREIKLSSKMTEADRYQLLFYLYQLKKRGLERKGLISYTKERKTEEIVLTPEDEKNLDKIQKEILKIINQNSPPSVIKKPYCKKCAYYEFCYIDELEE